MKYFLLLSFILLTGIASAQHHLFEKAVYKHPSGDSLRYRFLFPDANRERKYPLVIFLHGSGERGTDNEAQLKWGALSFASEDNMKKFPAFVVAPQCPPTQGWANMSGWETGNIKMLDQPSKSMEMVIGLVRQMIKNFPVDTNRIYITGLSMGGFGTFDAIMRYPDLFAAAVPVCGGGDISKAALISKLPIWIMTGAEDPAVPSDKLLEMAQALGKAGGKPGYTQYPEVGHFSWIHAYSDPMLMPWLFRQRKK
jgi:predicted peptidase